MYIKLTNGTPTPYTIGELRRDNPQVSFPKNIPDETLAEYDVYPLKPTPEPAYDYTKNVVEGTPVNQGGQWVQVWNVTNASAQEVASRIEEYNLNQKLFRAEAYKNESDPIFFKWQRGEAKQQEWLYKVEEIKNRYPEK